MLAPDSSLLALLRAETSALHARLDASLAASFTRQSYAAHLLASLAVLEKIEPQLRKYLATYADRRVDALRADLDELGAAIDTLPVTCPPIESLASAWGAAYVVQGSAQGGVVLAKRVTEDLDRAAPTNFFRLHGSNTRAQWQSFRDELAHADGSFSAADRVHAVRAASGTFHAYIGSFVVHGAIDK